MKKIILSFLLILSLLLMNFSFQTYINIHDFDAREVVSNIDYLSSSVLKGRLSGTIGNEIAAQYIKSQFEKNHLMPYKDSYTDVFKTIAPRRMKESPYLRIVNIQGESIKEYMYGVDYKEDMLNFRKNNLAFTKNDRLFFSEDSIQVLKGNDPFLFYVPEEDNLEFRSSFISDAPFSMYIMLTKNTYSDIRKQINNGNKVECFIPYEAKEVTIENIIGIIKGSNSKNPPVILSAHFDHVGSDVGNTAYRGALDNASGISFVMEMSRYLKSLGTPDRDIIFIGFNAEEFGCLGSKSFVEKYKKNLKGSKVFNFDMIGSNNNVPLSIMGGKTDSGSTALIKSVSSTCSNTNIAFSYLFEDASDHEYFRKNGIDAVTFCDNDVSRIHTPEDNPDFISKASIIRCFKVASREVIKYGYKNNIILIYYDKLLLASMIAVISILIIHLFNSRDDEDIL